MTELPLFPLGAVLLPHGRMALRIFEPRYVWLVSDSLKRNAPFGVVWIREGRDIVVPGGETMPKLAPIGTLATIVDWNEQPGGLLGITVEGGRRFRLLGSRQRSDYLVIGEVELLAEEAPQPLPPGTDELVELQRQLLEHPAIARLGIAPERDDGSRLIDLLCQFLPVPEPVRFELLAQPDLEGRTQKLLGLLDRLGDGQ
jgi:Lon protease-like protein